MNDETNSNKFLKVFNIILIMLIMVNLIIVGLFYMNHKYIPRLLKSAQNALKEFATIVERCDIEDGKEKTLNVFLNERFEEKFSYNEKYNNIERMLNCRKNMVHSMKNINCFFYTKQHVYMMDSELTLYRDKMIYSEADAKIEELFEYVKKLNITDSTELMEILKKIKNVDGIYELCDEAIAQGLFRETLYYNYAMNQIEKGNYQESIKYLEKIEKYKDSKELLEKSIYSYAISEMDSCNFENAKVYFNKIISYLDSKELAHKCETYGKYIGIWKKEYNEELIVAYDELYIVHRGVEDGITVETYKYQILKDVLVTDINTKYKIDKGMLVEIDENGKKINNVSYKKTSKYYYKPKEHSNKLPKKNPAIGMVKKEVEESEWGMPYKVNKTTTAYGISEQWCYSNGRYIYFENGYVTAIQE